MPIATQRLLSGLVLLALLGSTGTAPATVHVEARAQLLEQLRACLHLEHVFIRAAQDPAVDLLDRRALLVTNVECLRELLGDLDSGGAMAVRVTAAHFARARKHLATALALEEKNLARLDAKLDGKNVTRALRGTLKAFERKAEASLGLLDLDDKKKLVPLEPSDFTVEDDVVDEPIPTPPPGPVLSTNVLVWEPERVGKDPAEDSGWTVTLQNGKVTLKNVELPDGSKQKVFLFRGTSKTTTGTASFTTDDVLTPPFVLQGTGGLYADKEKDRARADGARFCLTLDREPQTVPAQFYGVCTVHVATPPGTQVFDFTHAGLAGGNLFFPNVGVVSLQIGFDGTAVHTEAQPRGVPGARVIVQNSLPLSGGWPSARAGFGGTVLGQGAGLGSEQVLAWSPVEPYLVTTASVNLLETPDQGAAVVATLDPFTSLDVLRTSAGGDHLEVDAGGTVGWIGRDAAVVFNTQGLPIGP